jgi:TM2 domain-containing membrane protein YozV
MSDAPSGPGEAGRIMRFEAARKSVLVAYLLWFFLGWLGLHRFYLGYMLSGVLMLVLWVVGTVLSVVLIGYVILVVPVLWWAVDALLITGMARASNNEIIAEIERGMR